MVQALQQEGTDLFPELVKNVNLTGTQVGELLSTHEASLGSQVEGQIQSLEQELVQLRWKSTELSQLANMQDHVCFLKVLVLNWGVAGTWLNFNFSLNKIRHAVYFKPCFICS